MKSYTVTVDINLPRARVVELLDDTDNLFMWQEGLESFEHLSGNPGQVGAKSKFVYKHGKQVIELTETITKRNLPDEFDGTYEWSSGMNTLKNRFVELAPNRTRWESTCGYEFDSVMLKIMGFLMPGMFRKQNQKFLNNFRAFCEHGHDVRDAKK